LVTGCWFNNAYAAYAAAYGRLYNWYAVNDSRGLTQPGWHIPSDAEWNSLQTYSGGPSAAGRKMKEPGFAHWNTRNSNAANTSGFSGLPGGYRFTNGVFSNIGNPGIW
jgi:uncharacterized protein (TIGR02145 family)